MKRHPNTGMVKEERSVAEVLRKLLEAVRRFDDKYYYLLDQAETDLVKFIKEKLQASITRRSL